MRSAIASVKGAAVLLSAAVLMAPIPVHADVYLHQMDPGSTPGGSMGGQTPAYLIQLPETARPVPPRPVRQQARVTRTAAPVIDTTSQNSWPDVGRGVGIAIASIDGQGAFPDVGEGVGRR